MKRNEFVAAMLVAVGLFVGLFVLVVPPSPTCDRLSALPWLQCR